MKGSGRDCSGWRPIECGIRRELQHGGIEGALTAVHTGKGNERQPQQDFRAIAAADRPHGGCDLRVEVHVRIEGEGQQVITTARVTERHRLHRVRESFGQYAVDHERAARGRRMRPHGGEDVRRQHVCRLMQHEVPSQAGTQYVGRAGEIGPAFHHVAQRGDGIGERDRALFENIGEREERQCPVVQHQRRGLRRERGSASPSRRSRSAKEVILEAEQVITQAQVQPVGMLPGAHSAKECRQVEWASPRRAGREPARRSGSSWCGSWRRGHRSWSGRGRHVPVIVYFSLVQRSSTPQPFEVPAYSIGAIASSG